MCTVKILPPVAPEGEDWDLDHSERRPEIRQYPCRLLNMIEEGKQQERNPFNRHSKSELKPIK